MLAGMLIRLLMVALTLSVVCWIGWSVPGSQVPEPLQAAAPSESTAHEPPPTPQPPSALTVPLKPRQDQAGRHAVITLDLNQATEAELERLPGIGPVLAGRIVEYRTAEGPFQDVEQLRRVKGIGKKKFEQIRPHVAVVRPSASKPSRKTA
jgi:competence protein ComEA